MDHNFLLTGIQAASFEWHFPEHRKIHDRLGRAISAFVKGIFCGYSVSKSQQDQFLAFPECCQSIAGRAILEKRITERAVAHVSIHNRIGIQSSTEHTPNNRLEHDRKPEGIDAVNDIKKTIKKAQQTHQKISILGSGYSQGGQTTGKNALQIDMRKLSRVINIDKEHQEVTVQAGATWKDLQKALIPSGLSTSAMQSYADFSIGGSIGVNAHGQDVNWNPVSNALISMRVLLMDGRYLNVSRSENPELFKALIGSYGLVGIIVEATLKVVPNTLLMKKVSLINTKNYLDHFKAISSKPSLALHSARISVNAPFVPSRYSISVNYYDTGTKSTPAHDNKAPKYTDPSGLNLLKKSSFLRRARATLECYVFEKEGVMTRNQAMGESVQALQNKVPNTKDILQEYFIPAEHLQTFLEKLKQWKQNNPKMTMLNATLRKVCADRDSLLPYAPNDCFAVVLFMNIPDTKAFEPTMEAATQKLIDSALSLGGRYYLPYALYARKDQVMKAYPEMSQLIASKNRWDPNRMLDNSFYQKYFPTQRT
ncbi:FAD-binding oxidoreductase [Endozoicomonas ascidiicola]|uniref:FAD-binding oxidoreductase n=1 Tax=Endozoicomonas ascidiicola TaxID=1698521 RepID=UPI00082FC8B5|nr:FAD-binding oxidoreductase [Endozoicomonas ascidiicola]